MEVQDPIIIQKIKRLLPKTIRSTLGTARRKFRNKVYYHKRKILKGLKINATESESFDKVILIVIDSLRKDSLSYYSYERKTTPFIDLLIQDNRSIVFHNSHSASSWTYPSVTSILSGLYPHKHGGVYPKEYRNMHTDRPNHWDDKITFLPDVFKKLGYGTVFFSPIGLAYLASVEGKVKGDHLGGVRAKQKGTTRSKEIRYTDKNKLSVTGGRRWSRWKIKKR